MKSAIEGTSWWAQSVKKCVYSDYVHTDRLGSVVKPGGWCGNVAERKNDYDGWGKVTAYQSLNISGGYRTVLPEITYAGHQYDDVLGMYYAKARMYDAENRRFASVDPVKGQIIEPLSLVSYLYCVDNPLRWVDPLGLMRLNLIEDNLRDGIGFSGTTTQKETVDLATKETQTPAKKQMSTISLHINSTSPTNPSQRITTSVQQSTATETSRQSITTRSKDIEANLSTPVTQQNSTPVPSKDYQEVFQCTHSKPYDHYAGYYGNQNGFYAQTFYAGIDDSEFLWGVTNRVDLNLNSLDVEKEQYVGVSILNAETGIMHIGYDGDYGGWGLETVSASAKAGINTKYVGVDGGARLLKGSVHTTIIPIPFTDKALDIGVGGEFFGIGGKARWEYNSGISVGVSFIIGGEVNVNIVDR